MNCISKPADDSAQLLDVADVAKLLRCSSRHVRRLSDSGRMPPPVRLGALIRWSKEAIGKWIASDCCPTYCSAKGGTQ